MTISVNLVDLLGIMKLTVPNKLPLGKSKSQIDTGFEVGRCAAEPFILELMNIHQDYGSEESYCDGSLFLNVDKMSVQKKITI